VAAPNESAVRKQLGQILASPEFDSSRRSRDFLRFAVEETLEGRPDGINQYTIATRIFGRRDDFDPTVDPIVRIQAGRLRRALERYYLVAGTEDPVRIELPKGTYVPVFCWASEAKPGPGNAAKRARAASPAPGCRVAVLPLQNLSGNGEQDFFASGLSAELTAELGGYENLTVIARHSTFALHDEISDPLEVGRILGVRFLLSGGVWKDDRRVKVTIHLIDASDGEVLWSERFLRDLSAGDLIEIQEEIARRAAVTIGTECGVIPRRLLSESRRKEPQNLSSYEAVLLYYDYHTAVTPKKFRAARSALEQAVERDPGYALAWGALANLYVDNILLELDKQPCLLDDAKECIQKGLALAPESAILHSIRGWVSFARGDRDQAIEAVERVVALGGYSGYYAGLCGWYITLRGAWEWGMSLMESASDVMPIPPSWVRHAPCVYYFQKGDYAAAYAQVAEIGMPQTFWTPLLRAINLVRLGREEEARGAVDQMLAMRPDFPDRARDLLKAYIKVGGVVDEILTALREAGLETRQKRPRVRRSAARSS